MDFSSQPNMNHYNGNRKVNFEFVGNGCDGTFGGDNFHACTLHPGYTYFLPACTQVDNIPREHLHRRYSKLGNTVKSSTIKPLTVQ